MGRTTEATAVRKEEEEGHYHFWHLPSYLAWAFCPLPPPPSSHWQNGLERRDGGPHEAVIVVVVVVVAADRQALLGWLRRSEASNAGRETGRGREREKRKKQSSLFFFWWATRSFHYY